MSAAERGPEQGPSAAALPTARGRAVRLALVAAAAAAVAWVTWPRPAVEIVVEAGGRAFLEGGLRGPFARRALPETVVVALGGPRTRLRIVNHDRRWQQLGAFGAGPGQTRDYVLSEPAVLSGACSVHPASGRLTYVIR